MWIVSGSYAGASDKSPTAAAFSPRSGIMKTCEINVDGDVQISLKVEGMEARGGVSAADIGARYLRVFHGMLH